MNICSGVSAPIVVALVAGLTLAGCASSPRFATKTAPSPPRTAAGSVDRTPGENRNPSGKVLLTLEGVASYYADDYHGKQTSNGEQYDMHGLSAAHRTFPFGTLVRVTNLENNKTIVVRINDRGPFVEGRIIDLSLEGAKELDMIRKGTARVKLEVLQWGDGT